MSMSLLDSGQAIRSAFEDSSAALKTRLLNSIVPANWDSLSVTYPSGTQEVYTFLSGGLSGTTLGTITINYTDTTKASVSNVTRT